MIWALPLWGRWNFILPFILWHLVLSIEDSISKKRNPGPVNFIIWIAVPMKWHDSPNYFTKGHSTERSRYGIDWKPLSIERRLFPVTESIRVFWANYCPLKSFSYYFFISQVTLKYSCKSPWLLSLQQPELFYWLLGF